MSKKKQPSSASIFSGKGRYIQLAVLLLTAVVLVPQLESLRSAFTNLQSLNFYWLLAVVLLLLVSNLLAAAVYVCLSTGKLPIGRTLLVQLASGFTNRILPSGIGAIGLFTLFISKELGTTPIKAATIATANNAVGFVAFSICVGTVLFTSPLNWQEVLGSHSLANLSIYTLTFVLTVLVLYYYVTSVQTFVRRLFSEATSVIKSLLARPVRLAVALLLSILLTICFVAMLQFCMLAAGVHFPLYKTVYVFAAGLAAIAASPTPNGLGPAEVVMGVVLTQSGQATAVAATIVLSYRLLTFWLPIIPGILSYHVISKRGYLG